MKKNLFLSLLSVVVSSAAVAAPTVNGGPVYPGPVPPVRDLVRYDFKCEFGMPRETQPSDGDDRRRRDHCHAFATIYTRDYTSLSSPLSSPGDMGNGGDNGGYYPGKPGVVFDNRMAIFCEDDGLIYADGARWEFDRHHDELVLMPPGAWYPQIRVEHPNATVSDGDHSFEASLSTREGRTVDGHCEVQVDGGGRPRS